MKKTTLVTMTALSLITLTAHAGFFNKVDKFGNIAGRFGNHNYQQDSRIVIHMGGQVFRGQQQIVKLKALAKSQNPGLNFRNAQINKVKVIASSARGYGTIALRVGQSVSYPQTAMQNYGGQANKLIFMNPSYDSHGKWQLITNGNISIQKVVLKVSGINQGGGGYPPVSYQQSCSANLLTRRGKLLNSFQGQGVGMTMQHAKQNACNQAMYQCQSDLNMRQRSGRNPYANCAVGRGGYNNGPAPRPFPTPAPRPAPIPSKVSASCTFEIVKKNGKAGKSFTESAEARSSQQAETKACSKASQSCDDALSSLQLGGKMKRASCQQA